MTSLRLFPSLFRCHIRKVRDRSASLDLARKGDQLLYVFPSSFPILLGLLQMGFIIYQIEEFPNQLRGLGVLVYLALAKWSEKINNRVTSLSRLRNFRIAFTKLASFRFIGGLTSEILSSWIFSTSSSWDILSFSAWVAISARVCKLRQRKTEKNGTWFFHFVTGSPRWYFDCTDEGRVVTRVVYKL